MVSSYETVSRNYKKSEVGVVEGAGAGTTHNRITLILSYRELKLFATDSLVDSKDENYRFPDPNHAPQARITSDYYCLNPSSDFRPLGFHGDTVVMFWTDLSMPVSGRAG